MSAAALDLYGRSGDGTDPFIIVASAFPPYSTPALTANLVFRVLLGIVANLVCLVPLRLLHRNGEMAAVVFIINVEIKNLQTVVHALIWRNDDMQNWWPGYGLCDFDAYYQNFSIALFGTCLLAIIRNLAHQVGLMRVNPLTVKERRRRNLIQILIMLPLPLVQLIFTWFLTTQRYAIGTLIGCSWVGYASWPYLVFFIIAPTVVSTLVVAYAVLTFFRFREVANTTRSALSSNRVAVYRAERARRRLYMMIVSIMVPFYPVSLIITALNIRDMGTLLPFDYDVIHNHVTPFPWETIVYLPSNAITFPLMNICYIPILTSIAIFIFFGMTKEAMNDYRKVLLFVGLGRCFPGLYNEYDPDRPSYRDGSYGSHGFSSQSGSTTNPKLKIVNSSQQLSTLSSYNDNIRSVAAQETDGSFRPPQPTYDATIHRNPFLMRTKISMPSFHMVLPSIFKTKTDSRTQDEDVRLNSLPVEDKRHSRTHDGIRTRVWSDEDEARRLCSNATSPSSHNEDHYDVDEIRSVSSDRGVRVKTQFTQTSNEHER